MLPGPRLFHSRYAALLFAGGVLWTACDVATSAPQTKAPATAINATGEAIDAADLATLANAMR